MVKEPFGIGDWQRSFCVYKCSMLVEPLSLFLGVSGFWVFMVVLFLFHFVLDSRKAWQHKVFMAWPLVGAQVLPCGNQVSLSLLKGEVPVNRLFD